MRAGAEMRGAGAEFGPRSPKVNDRIAAAVQFRTRYHWAGVRADESLVGAINRLGRFAPTADAWGNSHFRPPSGPHRRAGCS